MIAIILAKLKVVVVVDVVVVVVVVVDIVIVVVDIVVVVAVVVNKAEVWFLLQAAASPRKRISNVERRNCTEERCPEC